MLGIFLDIETNGLDPTRHRILEIAIRVYDLDSQTLLGSFERIVCQPESIWSISDPASLNINGFRPEMCVDGDEESVVAEEVTTFFRERGVKRRNSVFIGQNSSFDRAFFSQLVPVYTQEEYDWPYHWLDLASMYWAGHGPTEILSKNKIAKEFGLAPEESPHRAMNGVNHLITCYNAVMGVELAV